MNNTLQKFIKNAPKTDKKKVLMIDASNMMFRVLFITEKYSEGLDLDFDLFKHILVNELLNSIKKFKPDRVIFAYDDRNYWRKEVYADYKLTRASERAKSTIDFDKYFENLNEFLPQLESALPNVYFLRVEKCEADDIIAVAVKHIYTDSDIVNISTDKDYHQLMIDRDDYRQWNPIKKAFDNVANPKRAHEIKILTGDSSDYIKGIKKRCGPVTANKILDEGLEHYIENPNNKISASEKIDMRQRYEMNKVLIDFNHIPQKYVNKIKEAHNNYEIGKYNGRKFYKFLMNSDIGGILDNMQAVRNDLENINA